jgi:hypothetical protein
MAGVSSNPLMADEAASVASTSSGRESPSQSFGGFFCVTNDDERPPSPGNASTSSAHSRASSSSASTWRKNNPYNLKRRGSDDGGSRDSDRSPQSSSRQATSDHLIAAAAGASGASFGNVSQSAVEGFIFDVSHISAGDDGLLRKSSSSWTSTSSTFDKASGRVLERSGNDAPKSAEHQHAHQDSSAVWGGGYAAVSSGSSAATLSGNTLTVEAPAAAPEAPLGPVNSFSVSEHHVSSPTAPPPPPPPRQPAAATGPHSAIEGPFDFFPPGLTITVFPPNSSQGQVQHIPSERIIRTSGASNVYQVLLCAQKQRDEKLAEVLRTTGKTPTVIPSIKQPHSLKPKHCAHFQFKKVCNLGGDCNFIHSMMPQSAAPAAPQSGHHQRHGTVEVPPGPPPPPPPLSVSMQPIVAQPPQPSSMQPLPSLPPPPPQYTHHTMVPQQFTVAQPPQDLYAQQRAQVPHGGYNIGLMPPTPITSHVSEGGYFQHSGAPLYMTSHFPVSPMYHQVHAPATGVQQQQLYNLGHYQQQQLPPQGHVSYPPPPQQQLPPGAGHTQYFTQSQQSFPQQQVQQHSW